jgi:hypothetical protein
MSTSRKSSSRKSSSKKSLNTLNNIEDVAESIEKTQNIDPTNMIGFVIIGLVYNFALIYYLINLEQVGCDCIIDWRYYFVKYMSVIGILNTILFLLCKINIFDNKNSIFLYIFAILGLIHVYAFFTYIGDLKSTQCSCAVKTQKNLTYFFNIMRYVDILIVCIPIVLLLVTFVMKLF